MTDIATDFLKILTGINFHGIEKNFDRYFKFFDRQSVKKILLSEIVTDLSKKIGQKKFSNREIDQNMAF